MKPQTVTIPREFPRPSCNSWGKWLDKLNPAQLRAVHGWRRESYNALLSPKTCWYLLCGRHDPAERLRRIEIIDHWDELLKAQAAKQRADYRAKRAVFATQEAARATMPPDQDKPLQNDGEGPQIAQEAA